MIATYLAGATLKEAAAPFGYSLNTCHAALHRHSLTARSVSESQRHYAVDESFFDQIDSEEKAYWLGFLTADGSVNVKNGSVKLTLKSSDADHVKKFATSLHSEHRVVIRQTNHSGKSYSTANIIIISLRLVRALERLGVTERKSFTVEPCQQVPDELLAAYWRGIFDGDGSIGQYKTSRSNWRIYLCGSRATIEGFRVYLSQFINSAATVRPHGSIFMIEYTGMRLPKTIAHLLYKDATVYLDRKYELARRLIAEGQPD